MGEAVIDVWPPHKFQDMPCGGSKSRGESNVSKVEEVRRRQESDRKHLDGRAVPRTQEKQFPRAEWRKGLSCQGTHNRRSAQEEKEDRLKGYAGYESVLDGIEIPISIRFSPDKGVAFSLQLFSVKESGGVAFAANAASMTTEHGVQCSAGRRIFSQLHVCAI